MGSYIGIIYGDDGKEDGKYYILQTLNPKLRHLRRASGRGYALVAGLRSQLHPFRPGSFGYFVFRV